MHQLPRETVTTERVALVLLPLARGRRLTTRQAAELAEMTPAGAWRMLTRLSRVAPLYFENGKWGIVPDEDKPHL